MNLASTTLFVTGGASGLGGACARHFASLGAKVLIADIQEPAGQALATELGNNVRFARTDVTDEKSVTSALAAAKDAFGAIHVLINCAGIGSAGRVAGKEGPHDLAAFSRTIQINLIGTFNVIRLAAVQMNTNSPNADGERGVIINTASVAAFDGQIGQAAYSASKGGVVSMTLPIARELARFGIRVMTIAPGIFETAMMAGASAAVQESLAAQFQFPNRFGRPGEFALLAEQIVTNPMLNGTTIRLDGAIRMAAR